jgi:hypothetical protein
MPSQFLNSPDSMPTSPSTLALPKQSLEYVTDTDATESKLSACMQHDERDEHGVLHSMGNWSRQLLPTERRYHITEKEAFCLNICPNIFYYVRALGRCYQYNAL